MQTKVILPILMFTCVSSKENHTLLKYINRGKKTSNKTETGQDYMDAFDELTQGFEDIEQENNNEMTPYKGKPSKHEGRSVPDGDFQNMKEDRHHEARKNPASKACPENHYNVWSKDRIGPEEFPDIKSARDCSGKCSERSSCNHWIWHKEIAGRFAHQCVTITDFRQKRRDRNTVFGDKGCLKG